MKYFLRIGPLALMTALISGCFSIDVASTEKFRHSKVSPYDPNPVEHVVVSGYGWYLFNTWPIVSGNVLTPNGWPFVFFRDDITFDNLQRCLTDYAAKRGCDITDMNVLFDDAVIWQLSVGSGISIPIPYVFTFRERQLSGVLVKPLTAEERQKLEERLDAERYRRDMDVLLKKIPEGNVK